MMFCSNCGCYDIFHDEGYLFGKTPNKPPKIGADCYSSVDNNHFCHCEGFKPTQPQYPARPSWTDYFLNIAKEVSSRSTCNRIHVGVVVTDLWNCILVTGYNGAPTHTEHCPADESLAPEDHCYNSLHAENNVTIQAARRGISLVNSIWYLYPFGPCVDCQRRYIVPTHARKVVYPTHVRLPYTNNYDNDTLVSANVEIIRVP